MNLVLVIRAKSLSIKYTGLGATYLISLSNQELIELTHSEMDKAVEAYTRPNSSVGSVIIPMDYATPVGYNGRT